MHPKYTKNKAETLPMTAQKNYTPRPLSLLSANRFARPPQDVPQEASRRPKRPRDVPQEAPGRSPRGSKTTLWRRQDGPSGPKTAPKRHQEAPERSQGSPKAPQDAPRCPKTPQESENKANMEPSWHENPPQINAYVENLENKKLA